MIPVLIYAQLAQKLKQLLSKCQLKAVIFDRLNRWMFESTGHVFGVDRTARCQHKVTQDLAFLKVELSGSPVPVFELVPETNMATQAMTIGSYF